MQRDMRRWIERLVRVLVDFVGVQSAGVVALALGGLRTPGMPPLAAQHAEGQLAGFYFRTFLPISLLFVLINALFSLYTKSRGYTLQYKLRRAGSSALVASVAVLYVCFLVDGSAAFSVSSALLFAFFAELIIPGLRWLKDWMFHRESESNADGASPGTEQTVLVVGGAGYIGSLVVKKLLSRGYSVRLLDSLVYGDQAVRGLLGHPKLEFIKGDCRNIRDVARAMVNVRNIIHLAAIVGDPACAEDGENASQINYAATRMMAEIAAGHGIERFIFASTCSVYGASDTLMDENSETAPISLYAQTKLQSEQVLLEARSKSFHPIILRFATVFGLAPRPRFDLVVNLLAAKAVQEGLITIFNGDQWRPFIHVQDVAEAVVRVFLAPLESVSGEIFNVGDDNLNFTLGQVAEKIKQQLPETRVEYVDNSDRRNYRVSFRKIRECVGFQANLTLESGIAEIRQAFLSRQISNYRQSFYNNVTFLKEKGRVNVQDELDMKVMAAFASAGSRSAHADSASHHAVRLPVEAAEHMQLAEDLGASSGS
ncbi:MAG TPA: NAD-dependent epimerase/dehydratase family protein [Candidatus Acidoferrum sp.]|nr:NAD-dependent epimerase/dehydratase family protein [Candidatus Acidoferrum sp.]